MRIIFVPALLAAVTLLPGCSDSSNSTKPKPNETAQTNSVISYEKLDCAKLTDPAITQAILNDTTLECGLATVPADWSAPAGGPTIKIATYRLPSTAKKPAADPVVYLEGGPGGSGVSVVPEFASGDASYLRDRGDVVVIDQRGTGFSQPALFCPEIFEAEKNKGDVATANRTCHDRLVASGVKIADYNSHNNALDIVAVLKAMGYKQWNLYGLSYGTRLATTVMRDAPDGVKSVILDSTFPAQINGFSEAPYTQYWAIEQIVSNCSEEAQCAATGIDVKGLIENGIERLAANPVGDFNAYTYVEILSSKTAEPQLLSLVSTVAQGTDQDITELLGSLPQDEEKTDLTQIAAPLYPFAADAVGMYNSIVCAEEQPYLDSKASPDLSANFRETTQRVINAAATPEQNETLCQIWNTPPADEIETKAIHSDIPTLILAGTADNITPPTWGKIAGKTLAKSQYAEFAGLSHGLLGNNECLNTITKSFLNAPNAKVDQSCIDSLPRVKYEL